MADDEKNDDKKPGRFSDPKQLATLIAALTALVTAVTSLVKAVDKSVEQASYETLSKSIAELQADNQRLHDALAARPVGSSTAEPALAPLPTASPSVSVTVPLGVGGGAAHPSKVESKAPTTTVGLGKSAPTSSGPMLPPRPPMAPPPPWADVEKKAKSL